MKDQELRLVEAALSGTMTRKALLRRASAAGLSLASIGFLLSACGGDDEDDEPAVRAADPASVSPEWAKLVKAAQDEGQLALATVVGDGYLKLGETFGEVFEIEVEVEQGRASDLSTKILSERDAGQYRSDVWFQTWSVIYTELMPAKAVDPLDSDLIHPEITDPKAWRGGDGVLWMDPEKKYLPATGRLPALIYTTNNSIIPDDEAPKTLEDLLNPEWRDEIAMAPPGASGDDCMQWIYDTGHVDFLSELAAQKPTQAPDLSKAFRDLARGSFAIVIGGTEPRVAPVLEEGLPVTPVSFMPDVEPTGGMETFNASTPAVINKAPHPNAARLFANWVMTKQGATLASEGGGFESLRLDVPPDKLRPHQRTDEAALKAGRYSMQDAKLIEKLPKIREELLAGDMFPTS